VSARHSSNSNNNNDEDEIEAIKQRKLAELQKAAAERQAMSSITQPVHLTDSNFASETAKYPIMLVDFWAPWCGPCRMVGPIVDQLAREYAGRIVFGKVNVDENPLISNTFGISSIPTMMAFRGGKVIDVMVGAMPKGQIEAKLKHYLGSKGRIDSGSSASSIYG
jgi:thioredoxin 1